MRKKYAAAIVIGAVLLISSVYFTTSSLRMAKLYSLADRESIRLFDGFEARHFGGVTTGVVIESPSLIVIVDSLEDFEEAVNGSTVYTAEEPYCSRAYNGTNRFSDYNRVFKITYTRTYYVFNKGMTVAWRYTHTIMVKVALRGAME